MAAEVEKATQQADGPNGIAPGAPNGLGDKTLVESSIAEKAVTEPTPAPAPAEDTAPEPATAETVAPPAPTPAKEDPKPVDAVPSDPVVAPPAPVAEDGKVTDEGPKPVEHVAPAQTETSTEAPPAPAPVEALAEPAPVNEKPLETVAAPVAAPGVVSDASKPNGTATNGTTTISKEQEDVEMEDAPSASPAADIAAPPAAPAADSVAVDQSAQEPEVATAAGEKRKAADEEPAVDNTLANSKKAKVDEPTTQVEASRTVANPVPTAETTSANVSSTTETPHDTAPAPKKAGRPKKTQKEKVHVSPAGRTLRKTRSQGPVEV